MPNGLWYASGQYTTDAIKIGSAFSKGDLLALDSNSSLSRLNPYAATTGSIFGVATCDSTQSIEDKGTVLIPGPDTLFWSATTSGVTLLTGEESGISFSASAPYRQWVDESATTASVVVVQGTDRVDQSRQSKVLVKLKYADSELDLS